MVLLGLKAHVPLTTLESIRACGNNASSGPYGSTSFYGFYGCNAIYFGDVPCGPSSVYGPNGPDASYGANVPHVSLMRLILY